MKKNFNRHPVKLKKILYKRGKKIISENRKDFFKRYNDHCNIQMLPSDFKLIKKKMIMYTHFNIQNTVHKPKRNYILMKICKRGYFDGTTYKAPIVDGDNFIIAKCFFSKNYINYKNLKINDFKYSISNIKNIGTLKKAIKRRYKKTLVHLSYKEKISLGVAITKLLITKRFNRRDGRAV